MTQKGNPLHICRLSDVLSDEERSFLGETVECAVEEARDVLEQHTSEPPPLFDVQTIGEATESYVSIVDTAKNRLAALERILGLLGRN